MIAVIADDITGAAELAGISLQYFKNVELYIQSVPDTTKADVIIICTDSRSMSKTKAIGVTRNIFTKVMSLQPEFIYKKIDSVLRGYVIDELKVQMQICQQETALIVPANPSLGRFIKNGRYYISGKLITKTDFANDPEFPAKSDDVAIMANAQLAKHPRILYDKGVYVANTPNVDSLLEFADAVTDKIAVAGAGDFFQILLKKQFERREVPIYKMHTPHLYISGTAFIDKRKFIQQLNSTTSNVFFIEQKLRAIWMQDVADALQHRKKALLAFATENGNAATLRKKMANLVKKIVSANKVKEILIEGGATAGAIFNEMKITSFKVVGSYQRGTVILKANDFYWVLKPGSYSLPSSILDFYHH